MGKIYVSFTIVSTSIFKLVARELETGAVVYTSAALPPPHGQRNITITPVNPVMHGVELWTTLDGSTLDVLRAKCDVDASVDSKVSFTPVTFVVGRGRPAPHYDPAIDQAVYANPDIALRYDGATSSYNFVISKSGYGLVDIGSHFTLQPDGKGLAWSDGQLFSENEEYTIMVNELTVVKESAAGGGSLPSDVLLLSETVTFNSSMYGKMLIADSVDDMVVLNMPLLSGIPDKTMFWVNTHGGNQKYLAISLSGGNYAAIDRKSINPVYISPGKVMQFYKYGNVLLVVSGGDSYGRRGMRIECDAQPGSLRAPVDALPETGLWYEKTMYPGLLNEYIELLGPGEFAFGADDSTPDPENRTKFILGVNKFRMPDTRGLVVKNTIDDRVSNTFEAEQVGPHEHPGMESVSTQSHGSSSSALNGQVRLLVQPYVDSDDGPNGASIVGVVSTNAINIDNRVNNVGSVFYRLF